MTSPEIARAVLVIAARPTHSRRHHAHSQPIRRRRAAADGQVHRSHGRRRSARSRAARRCCRSAPSSQIPTNDAFAVMPGVHRRSADDRREDHHGVPGQPRHRVRLASGRGAAVRSRQRQPRRGARRDVDHDDSHRRRLRRRDARCSRARTRRRSRSSAPACRRTRISRRCARCGRSDAARLEPERRACASARDVARETFGARRDGRRERAKTRCAARTSSARRRRRREPVLHGEWLVAGRARERRRRVASRTAREIDSAAVVALAALRRPARVGAQGAGRHPRAARGRRRSAPDHIVGEIGEVLIGRVAGPARATTRSRSSSRSGSPSRTSPRRRYVYDEARAHGARARGSSSAERGMRRIERARRSTTSARRASGIAATVAAHAARPADVDAPAEIYLKLENLQPIGSFKLRGATNAMRMLPRGARATASTRRAPATWRRASRGARASSACRAPS